MSSQRDKRARPHTRVAPQVEPLLRAEGVDLDSLQFMQEDDLVRIGIKQLGPRRTLMAARRTQTQYKARACCVLACSRAACFSAPHTRCVWFIM